MNHQILEILMKKDRFHVVKTVVDNAEENETIMMISSANNLIKNIFNN